MFSGADDEVIPQNATHFSVHESVKVIPAMALEQHQNIVELICHADAFFWCPSLKRIIIPGVEIIESYAFQGCKALSLWNVARRKESKELLSVAANLWLSSTCHLSRLSKMMRSSNALRYWK